MTQSERDRIVKLETQMEHMSKKIDEMHRDLRTMSDQQSKWKGGLAALVIGGGAAGALLSRIPELFTR